MTDKNELMIIDNKLQEFGYSEDALAELSQEEKQELAAAFQIDLQEALEGIDLKPSKLKINKDIQKFVDPSDEVMEEIHGVIVYHHKTRGYWPKGGGKVPECSSLDGITGTITETGETRKCAGCPFNQWGSAETDDGSESKGKACKEMRRLFIDLEDYSLPLMLSLPPTSINEFDKYVSFRVTKREPLLAKKTVITLNKEESHGFTYAVAKFSTGDLVALKKIKELSKQRKQLKDYAANEEVTRDDYMDDVTPDESGSNGVQLDDVSAEDIA